MKLVIQGKNIEITNAIREYVNQKIEKATLHFSPLLTEIDVDLSVERNPKVFPSKQTAEVTIYVNGSVVRAQESNENLYASIDLVSDKIARQLKKYKERRRNSHQEPVKEMLAMTEQPIVNLDFKHREPKLPTEVVRMKYFSMPEMTIEDALGHLQLVDHGFYMFRNVETGEINVIYERNHSGYGVIQPRKNNGHTRSYANLQTSDEKQLQTVGGGSYEFDPSDEMAHALGAMEL
jgi:putative sigma-54 modulation protein